MNRTDWEPIGVREDALVETLSKEAIAKFKDSAEAIGWDEAIKLFVVEDLRKNPLR